MSDDSQEEAPVAADADIHLLLVTEDALTAERLTHVLEQSERTRFAISRVAVVEEALERLQHEQYDLLLLDLAVHEGQSLDSLLRARAAARSVPIVVLTYQGDEELARKAARAGAQDYLTKGEVTPALIARTLVHAVERHRMMRELTEAQQRQHFLANHDALTGLPNRYAFLEALRTALADAERNQRQLAVLFIDLDGFKAVNDNLGHALGDELLVDAAQRIRRVIRKSDLVARLGGDEFVAAVRNVGDEDTPARIADHVRSELEKTFYVGGLECWVSASIGVSLFPEDGKDPDLLIRRADTAMYHAKSSGRNHSCFFQTEMKDKAAQRFDMVNGLREAIHGGHLELEFQPQVDVATERLIAAETLVRWRHPVRGLVTPNEFIGVAEETGMMVPLGEWVLRTACESAMSWDQLPDLRVAVNVSGRQLEQAEFPERVQQILSETGLPAGRLEIELTESLASDESTSEALRRLRALGLRIALDDFGTGYSSLTVLRGLPIDTLKIDQAFIRGLAEGQDGEVILEAIVRMSKGLGLNAVAEGVETIEEMDSIIRLGCHQMQGHLLAKPIPKLDFERTVTDSTASWLMAISRPETWSPPVPDDAAPEDLGDEFLPSLKDFEG